MAWGAAVGLGGTLFVDPGGVGQCWGLAGHFSQARGVQLGSIMIVYNVRAPVDHESPKKHVNNYVW